MTMITDTVQQRIISNNFDTSVPQSELVSGKNWQQYNFENMPVAAAVTLLTKFQNDVRYAEGEALDGTQEKYMEVKIGDASENVYMLLIIALPHNFS